MAFRLHRGLNLTHAFSMNKLNETTNAYVFIVNVLCSLGFELANSTYGGAARVGPLVHRWDSGFTARKWEE